MAFLQPDILPAMAEAIHRQLAGARGARLSQENLVAGVVPNGLSDGSAGEDLFRHTLRELIGIGVIQFDDGYLALADGAPETRGVGAMAALVRTRAMTAERESDLWEKDDLDSLTLLGARDLVRALAWFMNLDVVSGPFTFRGTNPLSQLQADQTGERLIFNDERWRPFVRWARYLGFMRDVPVYSSAGRAESAVVPDPTDAVGAALPRCIAGDDWVPLSAVLPALAAELPVLDGGIYRRAIHQGGAPEHEADISPTLTLALERLQARRVIALDVGAGDAEKLVLANNRGAYHALRITGGAR